MRGIFGWTFLFLLLAGSSWARVWDVKSDGTGDAPNVQAGVDSCSSGDTVLAAPGTYTGAGNRDIDFTGKAIVVMSLSGADVTIVDCGGSEGEYHRGFYFHSGEDTTSVLQGFTIMNGYSDEGGAICCHASSPRILGNVVIDNYAVSGGGGIYCEGTHSIISGNTISRNETRIYVAAAQDDGIARSLDPARYEANGSFPPSGGGICCIADSSLVESNAISGGKGTLGSAIYCDESFVRVRHNTICENGGYQTEGTACFCGGSYSIEENTITENSTYNDGGGLYCSGGMYRIVGNTISYNRFFADFGGRGGGMFCGTGSYTIKNNSIIANENNVGGGIYIEGSGTVSNNLISNNGAFHLGPCANCLAASYESSLDVGGGILISGSTSLAVVGNTITKNCASWGGGIACVGGSPEIRENIIANNGAYHYGCSKNGDRDGKGGGLYCESSSPTVTGNTIYANSAGNEYPSYRGGTGIHCAGASSPTIRQNIVVANNQTSGEQGVGGIYCEDAASTPSISCCDVYANSNANYGGTLGDQTGLNGNFSLDPLFCGAAGGDYELHLLSPCMPGNHPGGMDCGLIGALGGACDFVATLLQGYSTGVSPSAVTIIWTLAQAGENLTCSVLRAEAGDGEYRELPTPGITRDGLTFTFQDAAFDPGTVYRYRVDVSDSEGRKVLFETSRIVTPTLPLSLYQNFPNPFNPSTVIMYYLPEDSRVSLDVYDVSGRRVADLIGKAEKKGRHSITWNGKDEAGSSVVSGIYFYRLTAGKETVSKKMILLR